MGLAKLITEIIIAIIFFGIARWLKKQPNRWWKLHWLSVKTLGIAMFEVALLLVLLVVYDLGRGLVMASEEEAKRSALRVMSIEAMTQLDVEIPLQQWLLANAVGIVQYLNMYYLSMHWAGVSLFFLGLFMRRILKDDAQSTEDYFIYRTSWLVMNYIALTSFYIVPTAPPRLMSEYGYQDTLKMLNKIQPYESKAFVNPYAAMPSLHFGWSMMFGHTFAQLARFPGKWVHLRWLGYMHPITMIFAIVSTGNHFVLDGIAGGACCMAAILIVKNARKSNWRPTARRLLARFGLPQDYVKLPSSDETEMPLLVSSPSLEQLTEEKIPPVDGPNVANADGSPSPGRRHVPHHVSNGGSLHHVVQIDGPEISPRDSRGRTTSAALKVSA